MAIAVDEILGVRVEEGSFRNELETLDSLRLGLNLLALEVGKHEKTIQATERAAGRIRSFIGTPPDVDARVLSLITCMFHWYGVSVCNYARLVGLLKALSEGMISRSTMESKSKGDMKRVREVCDAYVKSIAELSEIRIWRHKVFAHFAITDPYGDDNVATLDASVMSPIGYDNGRSQVGLFCIAKTDATKINVSSKLPKWALTEVHEKLTARYWKAFRFPEAAKA